jgi:two-component system NtrC family sensor kinase
LIASFLGVSFLVGAVSLFVGGRLLYDAVLTEAKNRVLLDLNAARQMYHSQVHGIECPLSSIGMGSGFREAVRTQNIPKLVTHVERIGEYVALDFAGVVGEDGTTLCRLGPNPIAADPGQPINVVANVALQRKTSVSGTVILDETFLAAEDPLLAERATLQVVQTPGGRTGPRQEITRAMALAAAIPIFDGNTLLGVLYAGILLNGSEAIVDSVRDTVFRHETEEGHTLGNATIFLGDVRIATNVLLPDNRRAIGTRAPEDVTEQVLKRGKRYTKQAFLLTDRFISAYEPIQDVFGNSVGMLGVGIQQSTYTAVGQKAFSVFIVMTVAGVCLAIGLGYLLASKIVGPIRQLIRASAEVSRGNFAPKVGPISKGEVGVLQAMFQDMLNSLEERDRRVKAENELKMLQSEKQASVGRLAGGVAHEINNPLTGVLTYTYLLMRRDDIPDDARADLQTVAQQTERVRKIVKQLLDFSTETGLNAESTDVNRLVTTVVYWVKSQALVKGVTLTFESGDNIPELTLDRTQMQSVLLNLLINALDATDKGDSITVTTAVAAPRHDETLLGVTIRVKDTGSGIPPENLDKLFEPFFTTKEVGKGTGLGLSVSYGVVQRHGGTIWVDSEVGRGTTFTVWLPFKRERVHNENSGR